MAAIKPVYVDANNDFCQLLTGDFLDISAGGTGATTQSGAVANLGLTIGTNVQAYSASLGALAALAGTGVLVQTGANTFAERTITAPAAGITITNGDGVAGNPTLVLANDLGAIEALNTNGMLTRTGADTWASRTITGTASNIDVTNGDGIAGNPTINLATVTNSATGTFQKLTTDTFGRVTGTTAVVTGDLTALLNTTYLPLSGGTLTGALTLNADPTNPLHAATKQYVDTMAQGLDQKPSAALATIAALPSNTYNNGTAGVGATLTATANGVLSVDGVATTAGMLILVKNEAAPANNGLYEVTNPGTAGAAYVLTRHISMDSTGEMQGAFIAVESTSTTMANTLWLCNSGAAPTVGTTALPFTQLNSSTALTQGNGISISSNTVSVVSADNTRIAVSGAGVDLAALTIGGSGVGTFTKVTVDTYGRVTSTATATASDVGAQASSASLTSIAGLAGTGVLVQTGANTFAERTLTAPAEGLTITNPAGVAGNPTFAFANDLGAIEALNTNGVLVRTAADTWASRTLTGTARITVTDGDGIAGNPTFDLPTGVIATPGTYNSVTVDTYGRVTAGSASSSSVGVAQTTLTNNQGATINIGQAVYTDTSGTVRLAQANALGTRLVTGLVLDTTINSAASGNIATDGVLTATTGQWNAVTGGGSGLVAGSRYYLSTATAGMLTSTAPTTGWLVYVGKALSTTQLELVSQMTPIRLT